jgi:hypothetical protein
MLKKIWLRPPFSRIVALGFFLAPFLTPLAFAQEEIGPDAIWSPSNTSWNELVECVYGQEPRACVVSAMQAEGASPQAIAFTEVLQGQGYMVSFDEMGTIDLATIWYPGRISDDFQYILVNGTPQIVHVEDVSDIDIRQDSNYLVLGQKYPNLLLWAGQNNSENMEQLPQGGQRFIFSYALLNGCHACERAGYARVAFDFNGAGQFFRNATVVAGVIRERTFRDTTLVG